MNKQESIELLEKQLPGFYSVEQVIAIIKGIDEETSKLSSEQVENLIQHIKDKAEREIDGYDTKDIVDYDSAEFDISYDNKLELSNVEIHLGSLNRDVMDVIEREVIEFFTAM